MKKICLILLLLSCQFVSLGQTAGLIAHWNFDSTTNDVSGGGHNGTGNNISPAAGMDGVMGHGYYFNGSNSWVSVPYSPSFNVNGYSICAKVKVQGYYLGTCNANTILVRGKTGLGPCVYTLQFSDAPAGGSCTSRADTTREVFWTGSSAPSATLSPRSIRDYDYTPRILSNQWYSVVATFNDTMYKLYVNGVLKNTAVITNIGLPMGSGTDGISIGYNLNEAGSGYPYPFKGVIDDIKLYNRPLSDTEVGAYSNGSDTCGRIVLQPRDTSTIVGGSVSFSVLTTSSRARFQWQCNAGTGYTNLSDAGPYTGSSTRTLNVSGITLAMRNYNYRCIMSDVIGCLDSTRSGVLRLPLDIQSLLSTPSIHISPVPARDRLCIEIEEGSYSAELEMTLLDPTGRICLAGLVRPGLNNIMLEQIASGVYYVHLTGNGVSFWRPLVKE